MKNLIRMALVVLLLSTSVWAQSSPQEIVKSFYGDYNKAMSAAPRRWMQTLMSEQSEHVEKPLSEALVRLAEGDPTRNEPFLDFDPFSNSQTGLESYTVNEPTFKQGLAYVPVAMRLSRDPGPERIRLRMVLRDSGQGWKIANVAYPAEAGMAAWDLKSYLKDIFQP
jgi:hypothetical protein